MEDSEGSGGFWSRIKGWFGKGEKVDDKINITDRVLRDVDAEVGFRLGEGDRARIFVNLRGLADYLAVVSEDDFAKYCGKGKNDFAEWIEKVVGDAVLARRVRRIGDSRQMENEINSRIKELRPYLEVKNG